MLVAIYQNERVEASKADKKSSEYSCPVCKTDVILKKGSIVIPHFAHRPDANCMFGVGEGIEHLTTKLKMAEVFREAGKKVEIEYIYKLRDKCMISDLSLIEDSGTTCAIEIVDSHDNMDHIKEKASFYKKLNVPCLWLPIIRKKVRTYFTGQGRYRPTAFESWLLERSYCVRFVLPSDKIIVCRARTEYIDVPATDWGGGYSYPSRAFVNLHLVTTVHLKGPPYPKPHTWYAEGTMIEGQLSYAEWKKRMEQNNSSTT